jgi:hypothetical protein
MPSLRRVLTKGLDSAVEATESFGAVLGGEPENDEAARSGSLTGLLEESKQRPSGEVLGRYTPSVVRSAYVGELIRLSDDGSRVELTDRGAELLARTPDLPSAPSPVSGRAAFRSV